MMYYQATEDLASKPKSLLVVIITLLVDNTKPYHNLENLLIVWNRKKQTGPLGGNPLGGCMHK